MEEPYLHICHDLNLSPTHSPGRHGAASRAPLRGVAGLRRRRPPPPRGALVCALGLNSMLKCVVRCTRCALADPVDWVSHRHLNAGLKREDVVALPIATYAAPPQPASSGSPAPGCAICLSNFSEGAKIRVLPACGHRFHLACIDTWLLSHCSRPTCRRRLSSNSVEATLEIAIPPR